MDDDPRDINLNELVRRLNESVRGEVDTAPTSTDAGEEPAPQPRPGEDGAGLAVRRDWTLPNTTPETRERLAELLSLARGATATDLFLAVGSPPTIRLHDELRPLARSPLSDADVAELCAAIVTPDRRRRLATLGAIDLSFSLPKLGRFRGNVHRERGQWAAALRLFPLAAPSLEALNLPPDLARLAELRRGLVLVTGPAGSGKSTTLAALLAIITTQRRVHAITIEDPVEYEHRQGLAIVEQIEVGRDTPSFSAALRSALRQDPDVLLVGEMRDPESIGMALTAAETGHLVFSTLHTGDAAQTISRIIDAHPSEQVGFVRSQVAASLAAVVCQQLLPRIGGGLVPAVEVLMATDAVRNLIQKGQLEQINTQITLGRAAGMRTVEQSLTELVKKKLVSVEEARARARRPTEFDLHLRG